MRFQVNPMHVEKYTLQIIDGATTAVLDLSTDIDITSSFGGITYPPPNTQDLPLEFAAYGTANAGNPVSGTMSNCDLPPKTEIREDEPPPDWTLYCYIVNPTPPCTLTVKQGAATVVGASPGLTFI